jgi:hypothetical protein
MRLAAAARKRRNQSLSVAEESAFCRYRGFDGKTWPGRHSLPIDGGLADIAYLDLVEEYTARLADREECDTLVISHDLSGRPPRGCDLNTWVHAGYDLGQFESQWSHFSVVLNEILVGSVDGRRSLQPWLNDALLFDSVATAMKAAEVRRTWQVKGADLERCAKVEAVDVFVRRMDNQYSARCRSVSES